MGAEGIRVYRYRWVILLTFMAVVFLNQLLWITFAPITGLAAQYYKVSDLAIGLLSLCFMAVYVVVSIPASWVIDTYGFRVGAGLGALLTGVFGLLRGVFGASYPAVLAAQIGIAVAQPFILNSITKVAARWFPRQDRATAAGLGTMAMYLGQVTALALTPLLVARSGIPSVLFSYGVIALAGAALFLLLSRERPPTPAGAPGEDERALVFDGLRHALRQRDFQVTLAAFFLGLGIFNAVITWIEDILRPRGFSALQAGLAGGLMVAAGVVGAVVFPALSDHYGRRVPFLAWPLAACVLGLAAITFGATFAVLLAGAFVFGFFLLGAGPVGFQYGAEVARPAPEGTTNGVLLLAGQVSGIIFILAMDQSRAPGTGAMTPSLVVLIGLMALAALLAGRLREPGGMADESGLVVRPEKAG